MGFDLFQCSMVFSAPSSTRLFCSPVFFFLLSSLSPLCRDPAAPLTTVVAAADVLVVATTVPSARAAAVVVVAAAALATPLDPPYTSASSDKNSSGVFVPPQSQRISSLCTSLCFYRSLSLDEKGLQ